MYFHSFPWNPKRDEHKLRKTIFLSIQFPIAFIHLEKLFETGLKENLYQIQLIFLKLNR